MLDVLPLLVTVALVGLAALALRRRNGVARVAGERFTAGEVAAVGLGERGGFVVFTAAGCSACGPARVAVETAAARHGLQVVVADAAQHQLLVRNHRIMRAPTTLLIVGDGKVAGRISGVPRDADLNVLLGARSAADVAA